MKTKYTTKIYNLTKATLIGLPVYILILITLYPISRYFNNPLIGVFGFILISTFSFIFQKQYKNLFTYDFDIEFDDQYLNLIEYNRNYEIEKRTQISWDEMESYKLNFSSSFTNFTLNLKSGSKKHYLFVEGLNQEQAIKEKSFFSMFYYYIQQYNKGKNDEQIILKPGFFATKTGSVLIFSLLFLTVLTIAVLLYINPKSLKLSFMGLFIILGLIVKRKSDKNFYELVNQLEPRNPFDN